MMLHAFGYTVIVTDNAKDAYMKIKEEQIDVLVSDIRMPGMSGLELLERIRRFRPDLPVILMTGHAELSVAVEAIIKGAFDFITKPYKPDYLAFSIKRAVEFARIRMVEQNNRTRLEEEIIQKTKELKDALEMGRQCSDEIIQRLSAVAEFRDADMVHHSVGIGLLVRRIAEVLDMNSEFIDMLSVSSQLHDIGKAVMPENILLKPSFYTPEEFTIMQAHTTAGAKILSGSSYPTVKMAETIALTHHEKWDGTGYPDGLKGSSIPVEGRIVMLADQYDALRSKRPFRGPFGHQEAFKVITEGDGRTLPGHFDPEVLHAFIKAAPACEEIFGS
jgi:putative two-component system response regulator